ncbi:MAG TPA: pyridoxal phosphate-dependent aminotransferase [Terriglobales bacterium]
MGLSRLARTIRESATLKLNEKASLLREAGESVIHLGGGEPKSKAPAEALANCVTLVNSGEIRYTAPDGIPALKKAIVKYTGDHYKKTVSTRNVITSGGAKQALMALLLSIVDPHEEVVFPAPYWVSYPEMVKLAGGVPVPVTAADGSFSPTAREMIDAVTPETKAIILNSPNNPSGVMYSKDFIREMVEFCEKKNLYLVMDDIYNRLVFDGKAAPIAYDFATKPIEDSKIVVINGVSKMYAMTGFRIGWAVANSELIEAMTTIQSQQTSAPASPSQWAALGALQGVQSSIDTLRETLEKNRDLMIDGLRQIEGVKVRVPNGTFYCFPDFSALMKDSQELSHYLLEKVRVVTVPGKEFGFEGHLRLSYCGGAADITEGLDRIKRALDPDSLKEVASSDHKLVRESA